MATKWHYSARLYIFYNRSINAIDVVIFSRIIIHIAIINAVHE